MFHHPVRGTEPVPPAGARGTGRVRQVRRRAAQVLPGGQGPQVGRGQGAAEAERGQAVLGLGRQGE